MKEYTTHLCTFMGRKNNLEILLQYIERALQIGAVDNYWMIDMTRCKSDHEYIFEQQQRLDKLFPGRVHIHNREERSVLLEKDEETIKKQTGQWGVFYSFLSRFTDQDIIAKCDDDTLFIDVETLQAAFKFRWEHPGAYLMHANCINNGVTAFHQHKIKDIWDQKELKMYPSCGLTGPLFSHPEIACEHHIQFCDDLISDISNIDKYKLGENIYFCNRVSINFIFMLGSDRHTLCTINEQDEYITSSKMPQELDRPNMIIGDFTVAHHTYGVQEPVMEKLGTYDKYKSLADSIFSGNSGFDKNKPIFSQANKCSTIRLGDQYVMNSWSSGDRVAIKNQKTGKYLGLKHNTRERTIGPEKIPTGVYLTKTEITSQDEPVMWYIQDGMIRTGAEILKTVPHKPGVVRFNPHLINIFYRGNYEKNKFINIQASPGENKLESAAAPGMYMIHKVFPNGRETFMIEQMDEDDADTWLFEKIEPTERPVVGTMVRETPPQIDNDHTYATCDVLPDNQMTRGYYWVVTEYIWEFIPVDDGYHIKLIADDKNDLYLTRVGDDVLTSRSPDIWLLKHDLIEHINGGYISTKNNVLVVDQKIGCKLNINI